MAILVLILGESGTGKTTSLRNFKPGECSIVNVSKKPLPFRSSLKSLKSDNYNQITEVLQNARAKSIVIDDAQYLMAFEFMRRSKEKGFDKFTEIGNNFYNLTQTAVNLPGERIVYFLSHIETTDKGVEKCKTIGKLLDEKITVEGLFSIVLKTVVITGSSKKREFCFATVNNGSDTVKSPIGMFEQPLIPNDLKEVDRIIREYYNLPKNELSENKGSIMSRARRSE